MWNREVRAWDRRDVKMFLVAVAAGSPVAVGGAWIVANWNAIPAALAPPHAVSAPVPTTDGSPMVVLPDDETTPDDDDTETRDVQSPPTVRTETETETETVTVTPRAPSPHPRAPSPKPRTLGDVFGGTGGGTGDGTDRPRATPPTRTTEPPPTTTPPTTTTTAPDTSASTSVDQTMTGIDATTTQASDFAETPIYDELVREFAQRGMEV